MSTMTVTEAAIVDLQRQREAIEMRARNLDPRNISVTKGGDSILPDDTVDALASPVRLTLTFDDPIATRRQIEALQAALVEALVVTQDHARGIRRQRMDLRNIIKNASDVLTYMQGKTPTNKRKIKPR